MKFEVKYTHLVIWESIWKCCLQNGHNPWDINMLNSREQNVPFNWYFAKAFDMQPDVCDVLYAWCALGEFFETLVPLGKIYMVCCQCSRDVLYHTRDSKVPNWKKKWNMNMNFIIFCHIKWNIYSIDTVSIPFYYTPVFRRDVLWYGAVRPSVRPSVRPTVSTKKHRCKWRIFFKFCTQVCLGVPWINLLFVLSYLIKYAHNSIISDFSIFGIHRVIF